MSKELLRRENESYEQWICRLQQTEAGRKHLQALFGPQKAGAVGLQ